MADDITDRRPDLPLTVADVWQAAQTIKGQIIRTPLSHSRTLSAITGADVWVKFENLQYTASFKERGALNKLSSLNVDERKRGVVAMSAGNHAQGVAYHAKRLGIPATIVMPIDTPFNKVKHTRDFGADVVLHGKTIEDALIHSRQLEKEKGYVYIHPYADPLVMAGQGTIALEMLEECPELDTLIVAIGGGGLIGGMATAAKGMKPDIEIIGVEASMYPSMHHAMYGGKAPTGGATIAEGIAVKTADGINLDVARKLVDDVVIVEETELERAITLFVEVEKTVAEGAGAAGLAALLAHPERFRGKKIGLVLCGGNIDTRLLASVLTRALVREKRITPIRIIGDDKPGLLSEITHIIGEAGANIIEVAHNRMALDVPAKGAEFDVLIETRDAQHTREVTDMLIEAGHPPR